MMPVKKIDLAFELHPPHLFDVGISAGGFVGGDGLDLALAEQPPSALISSAAKMWPFKEGSPSTAAGPVRKVMWPSCTACPESCLWLAR